MSFIRWHYTKGLTALLGIARNFLWFVFEFFSIGELVRTLFSPWHRDVSEKYWQGFNPVRMIRVFAENCISRVLGAVVRSAVIVTGLSVFLLVVTLGALAIGAWLFLPGLLLLFLGLGMREGRAEFFAFEVVPVGMLILSVWGYAMGRKKENVSGTIPDFFRSPWFLRVLSRVGIDMTERELRAIRSVEELTEILREHRVPEEDFRRALFWEQMLELERQERFAFWSIKNLRRIRPIARMWRFGFTPHIDQYGYDILNSRGFEEVRVCAHPKELESMKMTLSRPSQNSLILVAPSGTGKKSMIQFLAKQIRERSCEVFSPGERLVEIDFERLFSSNGKEKNVRGMVEQILSESIMAGNITLVVEDIDRYMGTSAVQSGTVDIGPMLAKYLPIPSFRMVATASGRGFHESIAQNEGLLKYMEVIDVEPISDATALLILLDAFDTAEKRGVLFTLSAFRKVIYHSGRFHPSVPLPERALDTAEETVLYWQQHPSTRFITNDTVDAFVSFKTGVPLGDIRVSEKEKLIRLEHTLASRVIGQPEAVHQTAEALRRARAGLGNSKRAIGSFLFLGPTGVGKTELAKTLSKAYFGRAGSLVRLDMSEFQGENAVDRLIGSREQNIPGQLTVLVQGAPYGVLLLDELEKANRGVLDLFLQILDEGSCTDAFGQVVSFSTLMIIATSNAGSNIIGRRFREGGNVESVQKEVIEYVTEKNIFRTEFLNRFDGVIFFRPIEGEGLIAVGRILLEELRSAVRKDRGIEVEFGEGALEKIVRLGYDPMFGARSMKRYIANTVESKIADRIIEKNISTGESIIINAEDVG